MASSGVSICQSLNHVRLRIQQACGRMSLSSSLPCQLAMDDTTQRIANDAMEVPSQAHRDVLLVAVSKTQPVSLIMEAWHAGAVHFGENYVQVRRGIESGAFRARGILVM